MTSMAWWKPRLGMKASPTLQRDNVITWCSVSCNEFPLFHHGVLFRSVHAHVPMCSKVARYSVHMYAMRQLSRRLWLWVPMHGWNAATDRARACISFVFLFLFYNHWIHIHRIAVVKIDHKISRDDSCYILLLAIVIRLQCSWSFLSLAQSNCEMIKCRSRSKEIRKYSLTQKRRLISRFLTQLSRKGKGIND